MPAKTTLIRIARPLALSAALLVVGFGGAGADDRGYTPAFNGKGELVLPPDAIWREWVYVGTPFTPNALNDGAAPFPEFHSVYVEPTTWAHYKKTGEWMEGAVLAKELALVRAPDGANPDGSTDEVSGRGYFMGDFSGFEITIKSKQRFPDEPGYWAYFTFEHHPLPYAPSAKQQPTEACNACHEAAAAQDFVFSQFYPVIRAAAP